MAKMGKWRKSPPELIALFEAAMPGPPAEPRKMFGYPVGFVNGHMFMGLFQEEMNLRLGEADRAALLALPGAHPFEPMAGHVMREYAVVPPSLLADRAALAKWIAKALAYAAALPPKKKAKAKAAKPAKKPAIGASTKKPAKTRRRTQNRAS